MKTSQLVRYFLLSTALLTSNAMADCLGPGHMRGNDPCNKPSKNRQNSFGDFNVANSRMSESDLARDKVREANRLAVEDMKRRVESDKRAQQAEIARQQQTREQEIALRQQEIAAKNRQAAALEQATAAAEAARVAAIAAQNAAQNQKAAPPPTPRTLHCNLSNGWCD